MLQAATKEIKQEAAKMIMDILGPHGYDTVTTLPVLLFTNPTATLSFLTSLTSQPTATHSTSAA